MLMYSVYCAIDDHFYPTLLYGESTLVQVLYWHSFYVFVIQPLPREKHILQSQESHTH